MARTPKEKKLKNVNYPLTNNKIYDIIYMQDNERGNVK
jgi:hypothetical protein